MKVHKLPTECSVDHTQPTPRAPSFALPPVANAGDRYRAIPSSRRSSACSLVSIASVPGIFVERDENVTVVHAVIVGPDDTPYEAAFFHCVL
ncbi:hypothetical protein HPB50_004275 [Hyalomma asiaticum]|uniref:Uncharacterized protein n=1 Tax=Hyalomma asiaticum TaxID=266040 RepID=A0ACB7TEP6_HYAAI|nr:hypothetical protein HPB50_004275 [Hyalomma asiaticum]